MARLSRSGRRGAPRISPLKRTDPEVGSKSPRIKPPRVGLPKPEFAYDRMTLAVLDGNRHIFKRDHFSAG